jgi:predicted RNA methylase
MKKEPSEQYWSMTEGVFNCLIDHKRSVAFKKAIERTVKAGDVVVDMGTGSGVLALFAARAGARKVYAVEIDKNNVATLANTFAQNGFSDIIEVIEGDITQVRLPEKVDVVIGEMIATALIEELQVPAMNNILKSAKKDCKVVLNVYNTYVDLVHNEESYYGYNFKILRYEYPDETELKSISYSKKALIDTSDFGKTRQNLFVKKELQLPIRKTGQINGVRLSGETIFSDGSKLGPTFAYSYPIILPVDTTLVKKGEIYTLVISYKISSGMQGLKYLLRKA